MIPLWQSQSGLQYIASLTPAAWYRYGVGITSSGGLVSAWADQSGNARHLVQATGTNQPALDSDNSILFDGVDNFMRVAFTLDNPLTFFALMKQVSYSSGDALLNGAVGACLIQQAGTTPTIRVSDGATATPTSNSLVVGTWGAVGAVFAGAAASIINVNGTESTGNGSANNAGGVTLAAAVDGSGAWGNVAFKEVLAFSGVIDAANRARIISYLKQVGAL